jgi:hypothetical protein
MGLNGRQWHNPCSCQESRLQLRKLVQRIVVGCSEQSEETEGGTTMKKLVVLVLVVLGLLAIIPAMEVDSSTQVLSRSGFADGGM